MEPPIYARHGVDARFVGHPLADEMPLQPDLTAARTQLGLEHDRPVLALLPGSRVGEIERLGPDFLAAAARVLAAMPELQVVVPMASTHAHAAFKRVFAAHPDAAMLTPALREIIGHARTLMIASDVVLLASGTATLEAMLAKRPMVVAYKVAPLTYALVKIFGLLKVDNVSLPNVLAGERVVPELMQHDCTPEKLADATLTLLRDPDADSALRARFGELHQLLRQDASVRAADAVVDLLAQQ
jgi:lipid-A-disaccharide synthase